jgi:hypothetical protein
MEPDGIFGNPLTDLLKQEGNYTFHALCSYGEGCLGTRELTWTVHVDAGIDGKNTTIVTNVLGVLPDGRTQVKVTFTPKDKYGNLIGPGRVDGFDIAPTAGSTVSGNVVDTGNGSYEVIVLHDPSSGNVPGIIISQEERPPVIIAPQGGGVDMHSGKWRHWFWVLFILFLLALVALIVVLVK